MKLDNISNQIYIVAFNEAKLQCHEYITPEHFLYAALLFDTGREIIENCGADIENVKKELIDFFESKLLKIENIEPIESFELINMFENASNHAASADKNIVTLGDIIVSILGLPESFCAYILSKNGVKMSVLLKYISHGMYSKDKNDKSKKDNEKELEFLNLYTTDLTSLALNKKLDPLIGREDIIERTLQVLSRRTKNNPIHVGAPGVGKTAIVEGIAQIIASGKAPDVIKDSKIYYLDMSSILAGTKYRGDFEERFIKVLDIILKEKSPIIYIDEIHTIVGAGSVSGSAMDATSILKPYLLKNNLKIIGSTTHSEYKKYFEKDRALVRRFQKIDVIEPSVDDCIKILNGIKTKYESFHNVKYTEDAISNACILSNKYIQDKHLPDKAIDVIDEAGAFAKLKLNSKNKPITINTDIIEKIISQTAKIPIEKVSSSETEKLKQLESNLKKAIFGQDKAIESIVNAIMASRSGLNEYEKPVANLLFVGPTGVGKTEVAKQLSKTLDITLQRFDMSEYQEKHSVARLIGSPPGYVGYEEGGILTEAINKNPYCVLLLDEIEKAHPDILNVLLQVMDYGKLTDNTGKHSDFRNVILIMTSNAGAKDINKHVIGFEDKTLKNEAVKTEVEKIFSPEFRNRLDDIIQFNSVNDEMAVLIAKKSINRLKAKLKTKNINLKVNEKVYKYIAGKGISDKYGAREINRITDNEIKKKLVNEVLFGKLVNGGNVSLYVKNNSLVFRFSNI